MSRTATRKLFTETGAVRIEPAHLNPPQRLRQSKIEQPFWPDRDNNPGFLRGLFGWGRKGNG